MDLITFDSGESVRKFQEKDRPDLYHVCLATGDSGAGALHLYNEKDMLGEIYVGPYLSFQPDLSFTLIQAGVAGYALAALNTRSFEDTLSRQWWPLILENIATAHQRISMNGKRIYLAISRTHRLDLKKLLKITQVIYI